MDGIILVIPFFFVQTYCKSLKYIIMSSSLFHDCHADYEVYPTTEKGFTSEFEDQGGFLAN